MGFQISAISPKYFRPNPNSQIWNKNFTLENESNYLIHASSGKGKSSFFNMLSAISKDYSGEIRFNDHELKNSNMGQISNFRLNNWSLVFQNLGLFTELTLKENLNVSGDFEATYEMLEALGLMGKENQKTKHLSYGERQRLAIIKSLNKSYDFLIMDEPFSHLDSQLKKIALDIILKDAASKKASAIILDLEDEGLYANFQKLIL